MESNGRSRWWNDTAEIGNEQLQLVNDNDMSNDKCIHIVMNENPWKWDITREPWTEETEPCDEY